MDTLYKDAKGASPKEFQLIDLIIVAYRARKYESTCSSVCMDTLYRDGKGVGPLTCIPLGTSNREWSFYRVITPIQLQRILSLQCL